MSCHPGALAVGLLVEPDLCFSSFPDYPVNLVSAVSARFSAEMGGRRLTAFWPGPCVSELRNSRFEKAHVTVEPWVSILLLEQ